MSHWAQEASLLAAVFMVALWLLLRARPPRGPSK